MKRRERISATLKGCSVDRPAVSFYELNGLDEDPNDDDPFNIFSHPSWRSLIELTREKTDRIVMRGVPFKDAPANKRTWNEINYDNPLFPEFTEIEKHIKNGSEFITRKIKCGSRTFTSRLRRDPDTNTVWELEYFLKNTDDLRAWLELPEVEPCKEPDVSVVLETEEALGDTGIVMITTADPLAQISFLLELGELTIVAMTETELFHKVLEKAARRLYVETEVVAKALPGRLWRIVGPELASPPFLPPHLFREYVTKYDRHMVDIIHKYGGFARIHSHGNLKEILDDIVATGCMGLDPIEPPPQGDVELRYVRERYGNQLVLFGNLEVSDIENLPTDKFEEKVTRAISEGTSDTGRGFVLMPAACPYGRELSSLTLKNYEKIIEVVEQL